MGILEKHAVTVTGNQTPGAPTLLFSHGFGCNQSMFRLMTPAFEDEYRIILYDLAGAGDYPEDEFDPKHYGSLADYARDVNAVLDELDLREVHFVGHSVSAMIGVLAAKERPEQFASLTLIGPSPRYINDGDYFGGFGQQDIEELLETMAGNYLGWSSQLAPAIMGNADRPHLGEELTNSFCKTNPDHARHFARVTFLSDSRADLPNVQHPTLVIQTSEDIIASEPVGEYVRDHIPGARYALIDARGHCPNLSAPEATTAALRNFLTELNVPA